MYTEVLDQNWIRNFYILIGYPIGPPSKLNEYNQAPIKIFLTERITLQATPLKIFITALYGILLRKNIEVVYKRSNMQLVDLNSKRHGGKSLRDLIDRAILVCFYLPPGS